MGLKKCPPIDVFIICIIIDKKTKGKVLFMSITKIVITGGPCGGKSTAMSWVQNAFTQMG